MHKKKVLIFSSLFVSLVLLLYFVLFFVYSNIFLSNTTINGVYVGNKTVYSAFDAINNNLKNYCICLESNDNTYEINLFDVGASVQVSKKDIETELERQNHFEFINAWFLKKNNIDLNYDVKYNKKKILSCVKAFDLNRNREKPTDAKIGIKDNDLVLLNEIETNYIDLNRVVSAVDDAMKHGVHRINIEQKDFYTKPCVYKKDLEGSYEQLDRIINKKITLNHIKSSVTLTGKDIFEFVKFDKKYDFKSFNKNKIQNFVSTFAQKYDTLNSPHMFKTHAGKRIRAEAGTYGFETNVEATSVALLDALKSKRKTIDVDVVYSSTGFGSVKYSKTNSDIGSTYVEISLSDQHMWFYKNKKLLVETDVVTGNDDGVHNTPKGVWFVFSKKSPTILKGDDYETQVQYWMALTYSGVGIHDSVWRSNYEYGGSTYKYNGSHGCINTPYDKVGKIYNNIEPGTPVVIY